MSLDLDGIDLGVEGWWSDRHGWTPVRERVRTGITGKPIVTTATLQYGRPITLADLALDRAVLDALEALRDTAGSTHTLTLWDGAVYPVMWRHADVAIESRPFEPAQDPTDAAVDQRYIVTLRFFEVPL